MAEGLFKNKYRIDSARLGGYDYSQPGLYFVTICTKNREHYFGEVENEAMILNDVGKIAFQCWLDIAEHFPFVFLGDFVVMPNHIHGILEIIDDGNVETQASLKNITNGRETPRRGGASLQNEYKNTFGPQSRNLSSIIRGYKAGVKIWATLNKIDFWWQPKFHDHIIRNNKSFDKICYYIKENPAKWERNRNNLEDLWM